MSASAPREWTEEEIREKFIHHVHSLVDYWAGGKSSNVPANYDARQRLEGFMHSLFAVIDGCAMDLPAFHLIPCPHPDDKDYNITNGDNYYPPSPVDSMGVEVSDIGGGLHENIWDHSFDGKDF